MNIDEYRAMVAAESQYDQPADNQETPAETVTETITEQPTDQQEQTQETSKEEVAASPEKIIVDGEEVTLDDIREFRKGYLRQSDYTQKTQSVAAQRREAAQAIALFEQLKANPHIAQAVLGSEATPVDVKNVFTPLDPNVQRVSAMEQELFDLKLQREIDGLQSKYPDFEVVEVLNKASEKNLTNLEDAYKLVLAEKPVKAKEVEVIDKDELAKQIRAQVLKELEQEQANTSTIISSNDSSASVTDTTPKLTSAELAILPKLGMTADEYMKWKNPTKR